ncbi:AAA family ATPase [archaeon]|nr:AAA family ATPase [archaeon]
MVVLRKLKVRNFRKLIDVEISFENGLTVLVGENEAGKSTIIEAILFALFGKVRTGSKIQEAISYGEKRAYVKLEFEDSGSVFVVEREITTSGSSAKLAKLEGSSYKLIAVKVEKVNEELSKFLGGLGWKEVEVTNVVNQKELGKLIELGNQNRQQLINSLLNIDFLDQVKKLANEELKEIEGTQRGGGRIKEISLEIEPIKKKLEEISKKKEDIENIKGSLSIYSKRLKQVEEEAQKIEKEREKLSLLVKAKNIGKELKQVENQISSIQEEIADLEDLKNRVENSGGEQRLKSTMEDMKSYVAELSQLDSELAGETSKKKEIGKSIEGVNLNELSKKKEDIQAKIRKIQLLRSFNEFIKDRKILFFFGIAALSLLVSFLSFLFNFELFSLVALVSFVSLILLITREYYSRRNELDKQENVLLSELNGVIQKIENFDETLKKLEEVEKEIRNIEKRRQEINERINSLNSLLDPYYRVASRSGFTEAYARAMSDISRVLELEKKVNDKAKLSLQYKEKVAEFNLISQTILANYNEKIDLESLEKTNLEDALKKVESLLSSYLQEKGKISGSLSALEEQLKKLEVEVSEEEKLKLRLNELEEELKKLKHRAEVLHLSLELVDQSINEIRSTFRPRMERNMNLLISKITNGKYKAVKIDEDFEISVYDPEAKRFIRKDVFSGGTVDQLLLAMRLSFVLSILPSSKGTYPKFLILDEPLSSSDFNRRQSIVSLLREDLTRYIDQVVVVTHITDVFESKERVYEVVDGKIRQGTLEREE